MTSWLLLATLTTARMTGAVEARAAQLGGAISHRAAVEIVEAAADAGVEFGIPVLLLVGLAEAESGYDDTAKSGTGCNGVMQICRRTARWMAKAGLGYRPRPGDVRGEVRAAAWYIARLRRQKGSLRAAVGHYNAGPAGHPDPAYGKLVRRRVAAVARAAVQQHPEVAAF
jgi:soluble lytic murein transglycosylase-like protein